MSVQKKLEELVKEYNDVITTKLGHTDCVEHKIELIADTPVKIKRYQIPYAYKDEVDKQVTELLETGKIRKSNSEFASPIVLVKKKDGSIRLCCDYRELNKITKVDAQPLRDTKEIIDQIGNSKIFTHCDLNRGFWQVGMEESSIPYTAFATDSLLLEWLVMPFGLLNSTSTCVRALAQVCEGLKDTVYFVDDICVYSDSWEDHIIALRALLERLRNFGFTVSPSKLKVGVEELDFLGFKISHGRLFPTDRNKELSPQVIKDYFQNLKSSLDGIAPGNIVNYDETNLCDDPGAKKFIFKRGVKYPERIINFSKGNISVMFSGTASGELLPPYVIYKSEHLWHSWCEGGPAGTRFGRSKSGWMDAANFEEWFKSVIVPWARRKTGHKVIIGDNLSSHISAAVIEKCE